MASQKTLEVLGLDEFGDSAVVFKARIRTKKMKHLPVKRAFNRLIKLRFDELGIEIPFPHQTVFFGEEKSGKAAAARVQIEPTAFASTELSAAQGLHKQTKSA